MVELEVRAKAKANLQPLKRPNFLDRTTQWDGVMVEPRILAMIVHLGIEKELEEKN